MPINVAAYDYANRSSEVTADVVARLGFIPDRVEKKLTVGQQRRGRRKKQSGRGGGTKLWQMYYKAGALRKYAVLKGLNPQSTKAAAIAALLQKAPADVSHQDMYEQYTQGLLGDKDDVLKKLPGGQTYAVEKANWYADDSDAEGEPSPAPESEDESITYSQPPTNPADDAPPADVSQTEASTVNETALVRQATSSILSESGFNSLDSIDSASDVDTLNDSIDKVAAEPPAGVMGALWNTLTNVAGRNTLQQVSQTEDVPQVARTQALRTGARRQVTLDLEGAADMSSAHASTVNASIAAHEASQSQPPATPSQGETSSGVDLSTAQYTPGAAPPSFAVSPVQAQQQAAMTSAIVDAVNDSQDARDATLLAPLQRTTNLVADTNRLLGSLNTQQLAAINRLGPELQTKLVTDRQLDRDEVPKVLGVLKNDPDIAELMRQGLVQPEQLKDASYVASLRMNLLKNKSEGRPANLRGRVRASKAPVFTRQVESRRTPGLRYYKPARHVAPSIFAQ
jgi:hypothetical protein